MTRAAQFNILIAVLALLLVAAILASLQMGSFPLRFPDLVEIVRGHATPQQELVLYSMRLPRLLLAMLVGTGLALSGAVLQAVLRNDLADPGLLGLSAGAGLTVMALLYLQQQGIWVSASLRPFAAFAGAALAATLIYQLARKAGSTNPSRILLTGIAVNAGLSAITLVLAMRLDRGLYDQAIVWLSGSLSGKTYRDITLLLPWFIIVVPVLAWRVKVLDVLCLGDEAATALGIVVDRQRVLLIASAVVLTAASVALTGGIGFIGLIAPHMCRRLVGPRHAYLLPSCALCGAILVLSADTVGRTILAPIEIPAGIFAAMIGAPYFLYLLMKTSR